MVGREPLDGVQRQGVPAQPLVDAVQDQWAAQAGLFGDDYAAYENKVRRWL